VIDLDRQRDTERLKVRDDRLPDVSAIDIVTRWLPRGSSISSATSPLGVHVECSSNRRVMLIPSHP
jgi:hypothetical protein